MHLKHNSWPTPHPSVICVELPGAAVNQWRADLQHILAAQRLRYMYVQILYAELHTRSAIKWLIAGRKLIDSLLACEFPLTRMAVRHVAITITSFSYLLLGLLTYSLESTSCVSLATSLELLYFWLTYFVCLPNPITSLFSAVSPFFSFIGLTLTFHSRLKTHSFHKSFSPQTASTDSWSVIFLLDNTSFRF